MRDSERRALERLRVAEGNAAHAENRCAALQERCDVLTQSLSRVIKERDTVSETLADTVKRLPADDTPMSRSMVAILAIIVLGAFTGFALLVRFVAAGIADLVSRL